MTKQDLVQEAAKSSGRPQLEIKEVAEQFMQLVGEHLALEKTIEIRGFGTFHTKVRKPRPARNPRTGEICPLGRRKVALFRFSADMKSLIRDVPELSEVLALSVDKPVEDTVEAPAVAAGFSRSK
ncbi:MAG TPA: HU family DNA-binding protein [Fibrobacteria bacterium]|nr:HU family DNA-binding protein [Fibrobacteria bacterium]